MGAKRWRRRAQEETSGSERDADEPTALLSGATSAWTESFIEDKKIAEAEGLGYSKLRVLLHTYLLFVLMGFILSAVVVLATYATLPTVYLPMCAQFIETDYGSGQAMPHCTLVAQPWRNSTESNLINSENYGWRNIYYSTMEYHKRIGVVGYAFMLPFMIGWKNLKKDRLSCGIIVVVSALWLSTFICAALASDLVARAMPGTSATAQSYVDAYEKYSLKFVDQTLMIVLPGIMLANKRKEFWGVTIIFTIAVAYAIFGDFISVSPMKDYGLLSTRTNPNYILLFRLVVFPITWELSMLIRRAECRMFGEVPMFSTVPYLLLVVFVRAVYARLLLVQLDDVGTVLVINVLFAFVQIIGSVTKRSTDDMLIRASCRDFRMAWAIQATKTYNDVLLSARMAEAASENAAILQSGVALITDFVCFVCETRYLASFKMSTVPSWRVLNWRVVVTMLLVSSVTVWSIMCATQIQLVVSMFCPTIYPDAGLLFERCNVEPLSYFKHAI